MLLLPLLLAPAAMGAAVVVERRLGAAAAGWAAALPVSFAVAVMAVILDAGNGPARAMALSAASHVPAQAAFALAFAGTLVRRGLPAGVAAGTIAYVGCSLALAALPDAPAVIGAVPAIMLARRLMTGGRPRPASPRRWPATAVSCAAASGIVCVAVLTTRVAGPQAAGAVAAFPSISTVLAVSVVVRDGASAGAHALGGLVRSLPCYLAFCLVVVLAAPSAGVAAAALGLLACLVAARATWHGVPLARTC